MLCFHVISTKFWSSIIRQIKRSVCLVFSCICGKVLQKRLRYDLWVCKSCKLGSNSCIVLFFVVKFRQFRYDRSAAVSLTLCDFSMHKMSETSNTVFGDENARHLKKKTKISSVSLQVKTKKIKNRSSITYIQNRSNGRH